MARKRARPTTLDTLEDHAEAVGALRSALESPILSESQKITALRSALDQVEQTMRDLWREMEL